MGFKNRWEFHWPASLHEIYLNLSKTTINEAAKATDIWKEARTLGDFTDVHVPAEKIDDIEQLLASVGLSYEEIISDVGVAADESVNSMSPRSVFIEYHLESYSQ